MPWIKLDDEFAEHPKVEALGNEAFRLHLMALCYCGKHLTDGRIPRGWATRRASADVLAELEHGGLWQPADDGWVIHDYLDYNPTREQALDLKEKRSTAGRKGGRSRGKTESQPPPEATHQASAQANASADAEQRESKTATPSPFPVPVPESPDPQERETSGARAAREAPPPDPESLSLSNGHSDPGPEPDRWRPPGEPPPVDTAGLVEAWDEICHPAKPRMPQPHNWPSDLARAVVAHWAERPSVDAWRELLRAFASIEFYREQRNFGVMWVLANPGKILTHPDRDDAQPTAGDRAAKRVTQGRSFWRLKLVPETPPDVIESLARGAPTEDVHAAIDRYGTDDAKTQKEAGFMG